MKLIIFQKMKRVLIATLNMLIPFWPWYRVDYKEAIALNVDMLERRPFYEIFILGMCVFYTGFLIRYLLQREKEISSLRLTFRLLGIVLLMILITIFVQFFFMPSGNLNGRYYD